MNLVKPCDLASHNEQFIAHETFEEQKSIRFTDACVHKHRCIARAYSRVKYRVKKKYQLVTEMRIKRSILPLIIKKWLTDYESDAAQ